MASWAQVHKAAVILRDGGVAAYPTEAVWGLGCDPLNFDAVDRVLRLKRRNWRKGLILIAADFAQLAPYLQIPSKGMIERAFATWPGPVTWVFPASPCCPRWISGGRDSTAVRVTAHPVAAALCQAFGGALVSTSANFAGREPARSGTAVRCQFGTQVDALVPGPLGDLAGPTPIRDVKTGRLLREVATGAIGRERAQHENSTSSSAYKSIHLAS